MKVGYFSFINQLFPRNSEFKTSASHCCASELLIISNRNSCEAAKRDRACIIWIEQDDSYWMCKYGKHDLKFSLERYTEDQVTNLAMTFGIDFRPRDNRRIDLPKILDSISARSLQNWIAKHPRMSRENQTVLHYKQLMDDVGVLPIPDHEYTGYSKITQALGNNNSRKL